MFKSWVNQFKEYLTQVESRAKILMSLPLSAHIQLSLDYTKLWCGVIGGPTPEELEY
jgi:hypothetical protein